MDGIGAQYLVKLQRKYCRMNQTDHSLYETVAMIIIFFPCHLGLTAVCDM